MDLCYHFFLAYAIILIIASLTIYLGRISVALFFYSFIVALCMIPIRLIAIKCKKVYSQNAYLRQVLDELLYTDNNLSKDVSRQDRDEDDDDDWFMKIARGN